MTGPGDAANRGAAARAVLATTVALGVLHAAHLLGPLDKATFPIVGILAIGSGVIGLVRHRPEPRWPWVVVTAAIVLFSVGAATRFAYESLGDLTAERPMLPELVTLPGYVLLALAVTVLANRRSRGLAASLGAVLDASIVALAGLALGWAFLIAPAPAVIGTDTPMSLQLLLVAYPSLSVFVVALLARVAMLSGGSVPAARYQLLGLTCLLVGDVAYMLAELDRVAPGGWVDLPYVVAYGAFAATALDPSMRQLAVPGPTPDPLPGRARLAIVALGLLTPVVVLLARGGDSRSDLYVLSGVLLVLAVLATWRLVAALHGEVRSRERLAFQATHDALTGLPNQTRLREVLVARTRGGDERDPTVGTALLFVDMDRFKLVNDTYGHSVGDELLVQVAERLRAAVRPDDLVARIGGDEFVVLLGGLVDVDVATAVAERVREAFVDGFVLSMAEVYSSASVGLAITTSPDVDAEALVRDADTAMYAAKAGGRDMVAVFDASMRMQATERLALEQDLRHAMLRGDLQLSYQPVVSYPTMRITGVEALIRWDHPYRGTVLPEVFVPVAEESGLIADIGRWVIEETCRELARWRTLPGWGDLRAAVNISPRQLRDPMLTTTVQRALRAHGLPGDALCLELTESLLIEDPEAAGLLLDSLRRFGVQLAIDDFGTGYSALAHLKRFTVDIVKIDRSFVIGLQEADSSDESLIAAIVAMSRALGIATVAEGVETVEQEGRLMALDCNFAQGFRYYRPMDAAEVVVTLEAAAIEAPLA